MPRLQILDLCAGSGEWSAPYVSAGYIVTRVDLRAGLDVRLYQFPRGRIHGILAAPPCTVFARAGTRYWRQWDDGMVRDGLSIVDACLRIITVCKPAWWALENPSGRLQRWLGPPVLKFDPCDYGDPYTKLTYLWGSFRHPLQSPVIPSRGSFVQTVSGGANAAARRSVTPPGFARAFFDANP